MYVPKYFNEDHVPTLHAAIRDLGFGTLVTNGLEGLEANHFPMLVDGEPEPYGTLHGHLARANPQWQRIQPGAETLAMFLGPNCYVSPSWYATKKETGKVVPTWNYVAIHAYGEISFYHDPLEIRDHLNLLTGTHEARQPVPWAMTDAPADYIEQMLGRIVGFRLVITRLQGKWKMSQNRPKQDVTGVREGLRRGRDHRQRAVAKAMGDPDRNSN